GVGVAAAESADAAAADGSGGAGRAGGSGGGSGLSSGEERALQKEMNKIERQMLKLDKREAELHGAMAAAAGESLDAADVADLDPPCGLVVTSADMVVLTAAESAIRRSRDDQIGRGGADGASARPDLFACGWSSTSSTGAVSSDRAGPTAGDDRCVTLPKPGHPFVGSAAMSTGHLSAHRLRSAHRRLFPDVYVASGAPVEPITLLRGAARWAPPGSVLGGLAAALLHRESWYAPEAVARLIDVYAVGTPPAPAGVRLRRLRTPLPADQ